MCSERRVVQKDNAPLFNATSIDFFSITTQRYWLLHLQYRKPGSIADILFTAYKNPFRAILGSILQPCFSPSRRLPFPYPLCFGCSCYFRPPIPFFPTSPFPLAPCLVIPRGAWFVCLVPVNGCSGSGVARVSNGGGSGADEEGVQERGAVRGVAAAAVARLIPSPHVHQKQKEPVRYHVTATPASSPPVDCRGTSPRPAVRRALSERNSPRRTAGTWPRQRRKAE